MKQKFSQAQVTALHPAFVLTLGLTAWAMTGCTTSRTTHTARTGLEQLLVSDAVDRSLDQTPLPPLSGRKVYVEEKYLDAVDKNYVIGALRQRVLQQGGHLTDNKEDSEITIEVCAGAVGTDSTESYLGVPGLTVPGLPVELPEVRFFERSSQYGTAKLNLVAYATATGELLHDAGQSLARSDESRWAVLGLGPIQTGSVPKQLKASRRSPIHTAAYEESIGASSR